MSQIRIMELRGTYKGGGGPDKTILLSAARHDPEDFYVLVTYLRDPKDDDFQITAMAKKIGVRDYVEVLDRSMLDILCLMTLNRYVKKHRIQIVHVHDLKTTLLGFLLKLLNPEIKIMHTAHGWIIHSRSDNFKLKIQYMIFKYYHLHLAVSKATKALMVDSGINPQTIKVLYNSIDTSVWVKNRVTSSIREEYNISKDSFLVGTVGRLSKEKNLNTFLKVAQIVLKGHPKTKFLIVGDGKEPVVEKLNKLTGDLGIGSSVIFTGHRTDLLNIYASLDLFLTTSLTEGLPNTVLEAMSMQIPVVATKVGGVPELIENGVSGILCNPLETKEISKNVLDLIRDTELRRKMSIKAMERVVERFSFDQRCHAIEGYYQNLIS